MTDGVTRIPLSTQNQALALITILYEKDKTDDLFSFLPPSRKDELSAAIKPFLDWPRKQQVRMALERLRPLLETSWEDRIDDVHPSWLARYAEEQSPPVAALLMDILPTRTRGAVSPFFSAGFQSQLESAGRCQTPGSLLRNLLTSIVVRRFQLYRRETSVGGDPFHTLFLLNSREVFVLVEELGTSELAMAFQNLPEKDVDFICGRLAADMREKVRLKIRMHGGTSPDRVARARQALVLTKDELYIKGRLIEFTGIHILAGSLAGEARHRVQTVAYALPAAQGEILFKLVRRLAPELSDAAVGSLRRDIQEKITYLAEIDRIRSLWKYS